MLRLPEWRQRRLFGLCAAAFLTLAAGASTADAQAQILRWHERLDTAVDSARASGKPLFVVFRCVR